MAELTVDRLHTRYVGDAVRFEDCLRRMVDEELDRALDAVPLPAGHVCVRRLTVPVRLDRRGAAAAGSWARQIADELARAVAGARPGGPDEDVVVYRRTLDVLVEMLVAVGRGDLRRQWAWQQAGVLPAGLVRPAAVAEALVRRPELAVAALAQAAPGSPVPLTAAGWVAVARAVAEIAGEPVAAAAAGTEPAAGSVLDSPVARRLPVAELTSAGERFAVARLLLLCAAPALSRSEPAIAQTAERMAARALAPPTPTHRHALHTTTHRGERGSPAPAATRIPSSPPPTAPPDMSSGGSPPSHVFPAARPLESATPPSTMDELHPPVTGAPATITPAGGVFFLIPAVDLLDPLPESLADHSLGTVVGWLAARFAEVGTDDPAVHLLAGTPPEPLRPAGPDEEPAIAALAARVERWLRPLLRLAPDDDLSWLWRRTATVAAEPGWAEITYALADVDTRIRAAGLDLDPGFVWWLGTVVRYRYA